MLKIGGKDYEFNRPTLKLLKEVVKVEHDLDSVKLNEILEDEAKYTQVCDAWKQYCALVFQNPDGLTDYEQLTFEEIGSIRSGFFDAAVGTIQKPNASPQILPASK